MTTTRLSVLTAVLSLTIAAPLLHADPLVMGPTPIMTGSFTAFDASNSVTQLSQNNANFITPPLVWTENLISGGQTTQATPNTWGNGSFAYASCTTAHGLSTSPAVTTLSGRIDNARVMLPSLNTDPPDTLFAYAGASLFFNFTLTTTATVTMNWGTTFSGPAPTQTAMFWDLAGTNPAVGSVAGTNNVDSGTWTGTLAAGEYNLIYTRHDGNTASVYTNVSTTSNFTLTVVPAPGAAAVTMLGIGTLGLRRRRQTA